MSSKQWKDYWLTRWKENNTRWHQDEFEPLLVKYFPNLPPTTVLVPLCGKTKDMIYLASLGHHVVGVELSEMACRAFFEENQIEFEVTTRGDFKVFSSEKIEIYCGDVFDLKQGTFPDLSIVYDRAAMIALPKEIRMIYTLHLKKLLQQRDSFLIFIIAIEYISKIKSGPPFSVSKQELLNTYISYDVKFLSTEADQLQLKPNDSTTMTDIIEYAAMVSR